MGTDTTYNFVDSADGWSRELFLMFIAGFVLATCFWLGLWYFQARPAQADALQEKDAVLQEAQARLESCRAERQGLNESTRRLESEVTQLDQQLKQAWLAYGRCAQKSKTRAAE